MLINPKYDGYQKRLSNMVLANLNPIITVYESIPENID